MNGVACHPPATEICPGKHPTKQPSETCRIDRIDPAVSASCLVNPFCIRSDHYVASAALRERQILIDSGIGSVSVLNDADVVRHSLGGNLHRKGQYSVNFRNENKSKCKVRHRRTFHDHAPEIEASAGHEFSSEMSLSDAQTGHQPPEKARQRSTQAISENNSERWQSGRMYRFRKPEYRKRYRGFESPPLRLTQTPRCKSFVIQDLQWEVLIGTVDCAIAVPIRAGMDQGDCP